MNKPFIAIRDAKGKATNSPQSYPSIYPNRRKRRSMLKQDTLERKLAEINAICSYHKEKIDNAGDKNIPYFVRAKYAALTSYKNYLINLVKNGGKNNKGQKIKFT